MSIGLLIISHDGIGKALLDSAITILGQCPVAVDLVEAGRHCNPETIVESALRSVQSLDQGSGVLVLADLYGSTPGNIASKLAGQTNVRVISGVNLPMLMRILNYSQLELDAVVDKAITGGRAGIFALEAET
jgi:PTS system ascorbate-specific IIA component